MQKYQIGSTEWIRQELCGLLGEQVTPRYALCLTHAQVAVWALVFPVVMPLSARALCLLWAALAVRQCRKNA